MAVGAEAPSLLSGLIFDSDGARLSPTHAVKKGKRYRYYVSTALITRARSEHPKGTRRLLYGVMVLWLARKDHKRGEKVFNVFLELFRGRRWAHSLVPILRHGAAGRKARERLDLPPQTYVPPITRRREDGVANSGARIARCSS
jgi:hypothetical protein